MSEPERLFIKRLHDPQQQTIVEELRVAISGSDMDKSVPTAVPSPDDIAYVISTTATDEWVEQFLRALRRQNADRAMAVAAALHTGTTIESEPGDGDWGDFGVSPEDSKKLLAIYRAIDQHLGWTSHAAEQAGDYLARIQEAGDQLLSIEHSAQFLIDTVEPTEYPGMEAFVRQALSTLKNMIDYDTSVDSPKEP